MSDVGVVYRYWLWSACKEISNLGEFSNSEIHFQHRERTVSMVPHGVSLFVCFYVLDEM